MFFEGGTAQSESDEARVFVVVFPSGHEMGNAVPVGQ